MKSTYSSPKSVTASERGRPLGEVRAIAYLSFRRPASSLTRIDLSSSPTSPIDYTIKRRNARQREIASRNMDAKAALDEGVLVVGC
jgi:hypothetical protein